MDSQGMGESPFRGVYVVFLPVFPKPANAAEAISPGDVVLEERVGGVGFRRKAKTRKRPRLRP